MTEYTREIKMEMKKSLISGKWSQIKPLLQQHGPELLTALYDSRVACGIYTALHTLALDAPDVPATAESIQHLVAIETVNIEACKIYFCGEVYRRTPLHVASLGGNIHQVRELLRCGADADAKDNRGNTPMTAPCKWWRSPMSHYIIPEVNKSVILSLLKNPPRTYKQELIDKRNILAMILNKCISIGTKQDINQMLISIGY
jgi:hypothetical protein